MLLHNFDLLLALWLSAFAQRTTFDHAVAVLTGLLCAYGRRTVSRSLAFLGRALLPWANHYHAFSRACWDPDELFKPIINAAKPFLPELPFVSEGIDDTSLKKTGKHIKAARWLRDTLSPPFHVNLRFGIRCLHCALLLPMHSAELPPTAISLSFEPAPPLKKPPKNAPEELHKKYKKEKKRFTLGARAIERIKKLREWYKLDILREADASRNIGDIGALLRREGLYSSLLTTWRQQREKGLLSAATGQQRGSKASSKTPAELELARQRKENRRLAKQLARAELVIEIQKKVSELLGVSLPPLPKGDDD